VTTAIGPLLGGYLVDALSWRAVFFLNVPLCIVTLYALQRFVPENRDPDASTVLDVPGIIAVALGLAGLTYGLIEGPQSGWRDPVVLVALAVGIVGIVLFPIREAHANRPIVPLRVFRSRNFTGANVVSLAVYFAFGGALLFLTLYLQQVAGYSPIEAGAALLPVTALLLLLSPRIGSLSSRFGARAFMAAGPAIIAVGFLLFLRTGRTSFYPTDILPGVAVLGFGMSVFVTPLTATVMASLPEGLGGIASGFNNSVTRVASLLAVAVLGAIIAGSFGAALKQNLRGTHLGAAARASLLAHADRLADDPVPPNLSPARRAQARAVVQLAYVDGFHWAMGLCALLCSLAAVLSAMMIRTPDAAKHRVLMEGR
jgi:predicted MFS family arabinose efflux permease